MNLRMNGKTAAFCISAVVTSWLLWGQGVYLVGGADEMTVTFGVDLSSASNGEYWNVPLRSHTHDKTTRGVQTFFFAATNGWSGGCNVDTAGGSFTSGWCIVQSVFTNEDRSVLCSFDNGTTTNLLIGPGETHWFKLWDNAAASNLVFDDWGAAGAVGVNVTIFNRHSD